MFTYQVWTAVCVSHVAVEGMFEEEEGKRKMAGGGDPLSPGTGKEGGREGGREGGKG